MVAALRLALLLSLLASVAVPAAGQCAHAWGPAYGHPGVAGHVTAMVPWDPDGAGPLPVHAVLGGTFGHAGTVAAGGLAAWEPVSRTWLRLPAAPLPSVTALAVLPGGELVVASAELASAAPSRARIATWDGATWTALGPDYEYFVRALLVRPNGELVAASADFTPVGGGASLGGAVVWNGTAWSPLGGGVNGEVDALAAMPNGDLLVGGAFATAGTTAASNVARWNGTAWSPLGTGTSGNVAALAAVGANRVFAGTTAGLLEWNGATWSPVPGLALGILPWIAGLAVLPGRLVVAGTIGNAGTSGATGVAALDLVTGAWSALGAGFPQFLFVTVPLAMLPLPTGDLLLGSSFSRIGTFDVASVARWDGVAWSALADGPPDVLAVAPLDDVSFAVGGFFTNVGNVPAARVARWDGTQWRALGAGLSGPAASGLGVNDLEVLPNGDLVAAGNFQSSGAVPARGLARWDGVAWSEFGGGVANGPGPGAVGALEAMPNGDLVAAGQFQSAGGVPASHVAVWRGAAWSALGAGLPAPVIALARVGENGLVAVAGRELWQWDGAAWTLRHGYAVQEGVTGVASLGDGSVVACGLRYLFGNHFEGFLDVHPPAFGGPVRYQLGLRQRVMGLVPLPDGSVLATSGLAGLGGSSPMGAARVLPNGLLTPARAGAGALCGAFFPDGDLLLGGSLFDAGDALTVGRLASTCPASAAPGGAGCNGSGGVNVLAAVALPWLGSTFRARASGMPGNGIAVGVRGLASGTVPLNTILPQGTAGCALLVAPDVLDAYVPSGGVVATQLAIPNVVALVGAVFHEQVVALELGTGAALTAATSTNRLTMTLGSF
jgi:hypothetical protein